MTEVLKEVLKCIAAYGPIFMFWFRFVEIGIGQRLY